MKVLIIGHPRSGKTTLANKMAAEYWYANHDAITVYSTDDLIDKYEWSVFSDKVADLLQQPGPWVIEGCSAVRGLRKYLKAEHKVDFEIVWLNSPHVPLVGKQIGFAASLTSIYNECREMMKK